MMSVQCMKQSDKVMFCVQGYCCWEPECSSRVCRMYVGFNVQHSCRQGLNVGCSQACRQGYKWSTF
jgi:hypothetical protein